MSDIFELELPIDSRLPTTRGIAPAPTTRFVPTYPGPRSPDEHTALSLWINAHQLFFIALCAGTTSAERVTRALARGDSVEARRWLRRVTDIRIATSAMTEAAGSIPATIYASYIRPTMASMRADFSGVSSRDNWRFDEAARLMSDMLEPMLASDGDEDLAVAWREYGASVKTWCSAHARVMRQLVGEPISLARIAYERSLAESGATQSYTEFQLILRTTEAIECNDEFFAVRRHPTDLTTMRNAILRTHDWLTPHVPEDDAMPALLRSGVDAILDIIDELTAELEAPAPCGLLGG